MLQDTEVPDYIRAFRLTNTPIPDWGPAKPENRTGLYATLPLTTDGIDNSACDAQQTKI